MAEINSLLTNPDCRLLTLVGPGGMGKTRLAMEAARHFICPDGVYFVPLQPLTSPDFIIAAIAEALIFQFYGEGEPRRQLLDYLRDKSLLLLLDNFEHLLDGVDILADMLAGATGIKLLTTSRERLNLREEWVLNVEGLAFPSSEAETDFSEYSAVQLFLQNARRVHVGFNLAASHNAGVTRICRLVGGMPLGIELAAAWVRALSCEQIANEIERSLDILETSARNVEPRHRTMRAAFEPTWARLTDNGRSVFMKLSVFRGGFTREAAEQVAGASLRTLSSLVDKSLLRVEASGRYDIHELLRQYGSEQLDTSPEECEQTRDLHSSYYSEFMYRQDERLKSGTQRAALEEIDLEIDNVRAAWVYMVEKRKTTEIHKSSYSLRYFLELRTRFREGSELFEQAAEALRPTATNKEMGIVYGVTLALQGSFCSDMGAPEKAKALAEESLATLSQSSDPEVLMAALESLAAATFHLNQMMECKQVAQEGLGIARERDDHWRIASFLRWLAWSAEWRRENAEWVQMDEQGLIVAEHLGDPSLMALFYNGLGGAALSLGHYEEAKRFLAQGLRLYQQTDHVYGIVLSYWRLAALATTQKNFAEARNYYRQELEIDVESGNRRWQTNTTLNIGKLLVAQGQKEQAVEIITLILHHPATMQYNREIASVMLTELKAELAPDVYVAAIERGKARDLEATARELIAAFSEDTPSLTSNPPDDLTEREMEILRLVADGLSNREIAEQLVFSVNTVKWYAKEIFSKLHVNSRTQAVARAKALGLLQ